MRASSVDQLILETLAQGHSHLSPHEIYERIHPRLPAVNLSTVYRSLERLVKNGQLSVSDMGTGAAVYERVTEDHHHHLVCQNCGCVETLSDDEVQQFFETLQARRGFQITTNHLVLFGLCPQCKNNL